MAEWLHDFLQPSPPYLMFHLPDPTPVQLEILDYIRGYMIRHDRPPTLREVAARFGFAFATGAAYHIRALVKKGLLRPDRAGHNPQYVPTAGELVAAHESDGTVRVGTTGPVVFGARAWRLWLLRELAATGEDQAG